MALHKPVLNYVYRTVGDRQVAEDVTQDAFIRAHARIDQLGPPWDFKSWVFRIASNLSIDHIRQAKRFVDVEEPMELGGPPSTRRPAERGVQRHEAEESVERTLALMQTRYRQALILKELNDLSYKEISNTLECSYDNARQLVHRARLHFRELHGIRLLAESGASACMELGNLVSAFNDGELGEDEQDAVRAHLAVCEHCQQTEDDLKRVAGIFAFLPPLIPSSGWIDQTVERIQSQPGAVSEGPARQPGDVGTGKGAATAVKSASWAKWLLGAAASLIGVAALVVVAGLAQELFGGGSNGSATPDDDHIENTISAVLAMTTIPETQPPPTSGASQEGDQPEANGSQAAAQDTVTVTPSPSPTPGLPFAIASANSNCRSGPGAVYDVLGYLIAGDRTRIRGRDLPTYWWVVDQMDGTGTCWVANNLTDEEGDLSQVPVVPAPPTPIPADSTPPTIQIVYAPSGTWKPNEDDVVTFTASASDDRNVATIEIYVQDPNAKTLQKVKTCSNTTSCVFQGGPYAPGMMRYQARAVDGAGNVGETSIYELQIFVIVR